MIDLLVADEAVNAHGKIARDVRILVGAQIVVRPICIVRGGDAGTRHHPGDQLYAFSVIFATIAHRNHLAENVSRTLAHAAV
jgi:hypothetical protein